MTRESLVENVIEIHLGCEIFINRRLQVFFKNNQVIIQRDLILRFEKNEKTNFLFDTG